jgi:hypothetical protein
MSPWTRHLMNVSLLLAVLAGARTHWLDSLAATWAALSEARQALHREHERGRRLAAQDGLPPQRLALKTEAARRLIAGELTLAEAAARFRRVHDQPGAGRDYFRERYPSLSAEEAACRQVIEWVWVELNHTSPGRARETVRRLEAELQAQLECEGKVELPQL